MTGQADVVVVGGGHNGLVAAAYLARAGLKTVVCERRGVTGGAAVSEHPFGPDYTVTSLSYVVSLLPPDLVRDLRLDQHGYHVYPQGPYFAPRADGRYLRLPEDPAQRHAEIAKFSAADADAYPRYEEYLAGLGKILGPLLHQIPPRLGSRRPQDLLRQARLLTSLRAVDERAAVDVTRLLTGSIADLLEGYFESDALLGLLSVSGVIGTWAGPRSAGTAYVMLHHHIGETEGAAGAWGFPRGGMGGVSGALARAARMFGAQIRTDAEVAQIRTRDGRVAGVTLARGESIDAPVVVTTAHPQISFLRLLDPAELPADFVADIRGWRSRSGTVKINLALDRLPVFASYPEPDPAVYGGTIVLAEPPPWPAILERGVFKPRGAHQKGSRLCVAIGLRWPSLHWFQPWRTRRGWRDAAPLPEGNTGIAAKYPGDAGIEKDPLVVFADRFEENTDQWDFQYGEFRITHEPDHVHTGKASWN